jgi:drug/metabolite transporter (DMT)-like permease
MTLAAESALLGIAFALAAAILFAVYFRLALSRQRSPYLLLLGTLAVLLLVGPFAIIQLSKLQFRLRINEPTTRNVGFYIYMAALAVLGILAIRQITNCNRRNRESVKPTM